MRSAVAMLRVAADALRAHPLRTLLSTLGIIVGVAALVAVLALGDGLERYGREQIERTTDLQAVVITPQTWRVVDGQRFARDSFLTFTSGDVASLQRAAGARAIVLPVLDGPSLLTAGSLDRPRGATVIGSMAATAVLGRLRVVSGRFVRDDDSSHVAVISSALAAALRDGGARVPGDTIRLQGVPFTIVGEAAADEGDAAARVWVPMPAVESALAPSAVPRTPSLLLHARTVEDVGEVERTATEWLASRAGAAWRDHASVQAHRRRLDQVRQGMVVFKLAMGAITGISLLVGGIGIMNVLLASVFERTREIGIRRASGARRRDILLQFLAESVAIAGVGSVAGLALGLAGAFGITAFMRATTEAQVFAAFGWSTVAIAVGSASLIGLLFGSYPALRAARISPIDAIRHE